jgi:hypothetical protein
LGPLRAPAGSPPGGIGFGTFIDELGKFITDDNDYFFQPTIALIYLIFIGLFVLVRALHVRRPLSDRELRLNAELQSLLSRGEAPSVAGATYFELREWLATRYERLVLHRWFAFSLTAVFVVAAVSRVVAVAALIRRGADRDLTIEGVEAVGPLLSGALVVIGAMRLPRSRLDAYRWFQRSVLVSILLVQVFVFLESQLAGLGGLAVDLLLYLALRAMIRHEQRGAARGAHGANGRE